MDADRRLLRSQWQQRATGGELRRRSLVRRFVDLINLSDEPHAAAREGLDVALPASAVADSGAGNVNPCRQSCIGDSATVPDSVDEFILADHSLSMANQIGEQVEDLRRKHDGVLTAHQFAAVQGQNALAEP